MAAVEKGKRPSRKTCMDAFSPLCPPPLLQDLRACQRPVEWAVATDLLEKKTRITWREQGFFFFLTPFFFSSGWLEQLKHRKCKNVEGGEKNAPLWSNMSRCYSACNGWRVTVLQLFHPNLTGLFFFFLRQKLLLVATYQIKKKNRWG